LSQGHSVEQLLLALRLQQRLCQRQLPSMLQEAEQVIIQTMKMSLALQLD
jgi:hypothetical protein